jgi:hypothetical protein
MVGVREGEVRLVVEMGDARFVVRQMTDAKTSTAGTLLAHLPLLCREMRAQLLRVEAREKQNSAPEKELPPACTGGNESPPTKERN